MDVNRLLTDCTYKRESLTVCCEDVNRLYLLALELDLYVETCIFCPSKMNSTLINNLGSHYVTNKVFVVSCFLIIIIRIPRSYNQSSKNHLTLNPNIELLRTTFICVFKLPLNDVNILFKIISLHFNSSKVFKIHFESRV